MTRRPPIRVLVIDDSSASRRSIVGMLERSPLVEVVGWAPDGQEALRKALDLDPDLITLDLEMPRMDGFTFLRLLMAKKPTPILVISSRRGHQDVFKALELGAVDFVAKPFGREASGLEAIEQQLIRKVHAIPQLRIEKVRERIVAGSGPAPRPSALAAPPGLVVLAASTGGPAALMQIFGEFRAPSDSAFLVCQHMPEGFTTGFADRIDRLTVFEAREARDGDEIRAGRVLVAPGGFHLAVESQGECARVRLEPPQDTDKYAPRADRSLESAAKHFGSGLMAVVLTGMGDDGVEGARSVRECGGSVIAESEESAVVFGMPERVIRAGLADAVLPLSEIPAALQAGAGPSPRQRDETR